MVVAKTLLDERQLVAPKMYKIYSESVFNIFAKLLLLNIGRIPTATSLLSRL